MKTAITFIYTPAFCILLTTHALNDSEYQYTIQSMQGWTIHVQNELLGAQKELGGKVLKLLETKLYEINRTVPKEALKALHEVPIWVDVKAKQFPCAVYHPSPDWLREHGFDPSKARSVHIANAENFLKWTLDQPSMVLHELAHAYHHQVLGYDCPEIKNAYQRAVKSGTYESVLHYNGTMGKAYALNNDQEYFAELTEAFFGTNDFYPFVRAEVMKHDPEIYSVLTNLWKIGK